MAKVELKQPVVNEISGNLDGAKAALLVQYLGLTVEQDTALRKELREAGVIYKVYKNTLMKRAFDGTEFDALDKHLEGPNAIAISKEDPVAPARILAKYAKQYKVFNMVAGVVEGTYYDDKRTSLASSSRSQSRMHRQKKLRQQNNKPRQEKPPERSRIAAAA